MPVFIAVVGFGLHQVCPEKGCGRVLGGTNYEAAQPNSTNVNLPEARGYCLDTLDEVMREYAQG